MQIAGADHADELHRAGPLAAQRTDEKIGNDLPLKCVRPECGANGARKHVAALALIPGPADDSQQAVGSDCPDPESGVAIMSREAAANLAALAVAVRMRTTPGTGLPRISRLGEEERACGEQGRQLHHSLHREICRTTGGCGEAMSNRTSLQDTRQCRNSNAAASGSACIAAM